jgi:hypothetical protein
MQIAVRDHVQGAKSAKLHESLEGGAWKKRKEGKDWIKTFNAWLLLVAFDCF